MLGMSPNLFLNVKFEYKKIETKIYKMAIVKLLSIPCALFENWAVVQRKTK